MLNKNISINLVWRNISLNVLNYERNIPSNMLTSQRR